MQNSKFLRFGLFFLGFLLLFQLFSPSKNPANQDDVELAIKDKMPSGKEVQLQVINRMETPLIVATPCEKNPLKVEYYANGEWMEKVSNAKAANCEPNLEVAPGKTELLHYGPWNKDLFKELGRYRISLSLKDGEKERVFSKEFEVTKPSFLRQLGRDLLYRPIFNTLIFLISVIPGHSLAWGVILLTLLIKIILLGPNQKALKAQKQMQRIQPQLEALKIKYKGDQQTLAKETMELWKKHKVSPMSSCLPLLIQFPILIALFYVVRDGLATVDPAMLYGTLATFDLTTVHTNFLGIIELTQKNIIALPIIVGVLQFLQMHLALGKKKTETKDAASPLPGMNKMMLYVMPAMIAFFTATLPAVVGFYWATSTLFGIAQQLVVNRMKD